MRNSVTRRVVVKTALRALTLALPQAAGAQSSGEKFQRWVTAFKPRALAR